MTSMLSLISTVTSGEKGRTKSRSRFNGFGAALQTVENGSLESCSLLHRAKAGKATVLMRGPVESKIGVSSVVARHPVSGLREVLSVLRVLRLFAAKSRR